MADGSMMQTAYHVVDGPSQMYAVDAQTAVTRHPEEWRRTPWSIEETNEFRRRKYDADVTAAQQAGLQPPPPPVDVQLTPDQQTEVDEDQKARDDAKALVEKFDKEERDRQDYLDKVAAARTLLTSPRPQPEPVPARDTPTQNAGPVDIPAGWRDLSVAKRRALAIRLGAPNTVTADDADTKIENEAKARDGAKSDTRGNPSGSVGTTPEQQPAIGTAGPLSAKATGL
jgi:hypothetical protein